MNKELKEALFEINPCIYCKNDIKKCNDCNKPNSFQLIKSALERLEKLEKVWKIIKNNIVIEEANIYLLVTRELFHIPCNDIYINREKFYLLKGILEEK